MLVTPPLLAAYATDPPNPPVHQPCELKVIIRPPRPMFIIALPAERQRKNAAFRLMSCWKSQSSSDTSSRLARRRSTPARFASTYRFPSSLQARCTNATCSVRSPRLLATGTCPEPSKPETTSSTFSWSKSTAITFAPVAANAFATARPIPPAAPVTITPLPSSPAPTFQVMPVFPFTRIGLTRN